MAGVADFKVFCSFCEDGFMEENALIDHLMQCGNKTDQCPNCEKYIRRAIFAYHYENNCAYIDESPSDNRKHNEPQSSNEKPVTEKNCIQNPNNLQSGPHQGSLYPNLDETPQSNNSADDARIPCEWCGQGVPLELFENHAKACRDQEHKRLEGKSKSADHLKNNQKPNPRPPGRSRQNPKNSRPVGAFDAIKNFFGFVSCRFCRKTISSTGRQYHEIYCGKNPHRAMKKQ